MEVSILRITSLYLWIYFNIYITVKSTAILQGAKEYCNWESVNATCAQNEVLVVESARYGRMAAGRCVSKEYGYVGCFSDVLDVLDSRCSGRRKCSFPVNEFVPLNVRPCPKDVTSYLEVSHRCLPVSHGTVSTCVNDRKLVLTSTSGYVSSSMTVDHGFGTSGCPWVIKAKEGQKINFTLIDFGVYDRKQDGGERRSLYCHKYAEIREGLTGQHTPICAGSEREKNVYVSKGSTVYITLPKVDKKGSQFLLRYETFGCPNLEAKRGTMVKMTGTTARVTCDMTGESWQMTCRGSTWFGKTANCTAVKEDENWTTLFGSEWSSSGGILVVIALGVGLGIVIGVCLLGISLVVLKRRGWKFGCGKHKEHTDMSPSMVTKQTPVYDYNPSAHKYSSGYGSEALLNDNIPIDPRYNTGHYGDMHTGSWVTASTGVHGYNRSLSRTSQSSLGHIYESPDFLNPIGGTSRDTC